MHGKHTVNVRPPTHSIVDPDQAFMIEASTFARDHHMSVPTEEDLRAMLLPPQSLVTDPLKPYLTTDQRFFVS